MKKCYADKDLQISKDDFIEPEEMSIKVDCGGPSKYSNGTSRRRDSTAVEQEQNTDEFEL